MDDPEAKKAKLSTDNQGPSTSEDTSVGTGLAGSISDAPAKFLQTMALWLEGAGDPTRDGGGLLSSWSAPYAADCDFEDEPKPVDMAPVLGLPQGTDKQEFFRIVDQQEEDLIKQLIS